MRTKSAIILSMAAIIFSACGEKPKNMSAEPSSKQESVAKSELKVGDKAPTFKTQGALAGAEVALDLEEKLKEGPLVLYFFPKVFTPGCTAEAHEFAEKTAEFKKLGANVIGMSGDDIEGLKKFSKEECRDKFMVARADKETIKAYNVALAVSDSMSNRTSFVIGSDGLIKHIYSNSDYREHVNETFKAIEALSKAK